MICVIATIEVLPGRREEFLAAIRRVVPTVRSERGCLEYQPMIDLAGGVSGQAPRENVVVVVEQWETVDALETHLATPHMVDFRKTTKPLRAATTLQVLQPAQ